MESSHRINLEKKATVIGGEGFIGRNLAMRLRDEGWNCQVIGRKNTFPLESDMGIVFYCAGLTADYLQRPFDTVDAHVNHLSQVLRARRYERLVYLSSTRLYDSSSQSVADEDDPLILSPCNSRHLYDLSKALGESLCMVTGEEKAIIARLSCVYKDQHDPQGFLPSLLRQIIDNRPKTLEVASSPFFSRDYVYLDDVIEALLLIATKGQERMYNIASGRNIDNGTLFSLITSVSGTEIVATRNDRIPTPARISIKKMTLEFAWQPVLVERIVEKIFLENPAC